MRRIRKQRKQNLRTLTYTINHLGARYKKNNVCKAAKQKNTFRNLSN
jgi:hypothetical protein